ncbi:DUF1510 family protein [Lentibacillus sp. N15]|uniref:YrrS family protein n=1 Tax=Lentibacillus songyuanensis TaxID=3136161 RepID=UPI0031BB7067
MDNNNNSRVDKFEKRRKNTKLLSIMLVVGAILIVLLIGTFIFSGNDKTETVDNQQQATDQQTKEVDDTSEADDQEEKDEDQADDQEESDDESEDHDGVNKKKVESPDDDNVKEAYVGDWKPIGTEQQGPHTMNFDEGAQDRKEMEKAASVATDLDEGNMTAWWLERDGDQQVVATVSGKDENQAYRVYLSWVDEQGWQPKKIEVLKENDQKHRFE